MGSNDRSYAKQMISPQQIDDATVFISYNGSQLREFLYTDVEQAYQAKDLTLLSTDILAKPIDIAFSQNESVLYIVLEDGSISCLTSYRTEEVNAWSKLKTNGKFISIAVLGDEIYFSTYRNGKYFIEQFTDDSYADCSVYLSSEIPQNIWNGLDYLEGMEVSILADGFSVGKHKVTNGSIELLEAAKELIIGIPYEHIIEPLPYMVDAVNPFSPSGLRIINTRFRVINTKSFRIDLGQGYFQVPLKRVHRDTILDSPPKRYLGDINLRSFVAIISIVFNYIGDLSYNLYPNKSDNIGKILSFRNDLINIFTTIWLLSLFFNKKIMVFFWLLAFSQVYVSSMQVRELCEINAKEYCEDNNCDTNMYIASKCK